MIDYFFSNYKIINDITNLNKKEYADLLAQEIEYLLGLLIPELEKEPIIIDFGLSFQFKLLENYQTTCSVSIARESEPDM